MTIILDGKAISKKILDNIETQIKKLSIKPKLAVILVGNNPASQVYVRSKERAANQIGIESLAIELSAETTEEDLIQHIHILNEDKRINAILVQLPLPKHIDTNKILEKITPTKDVDGFHPYNCGKLFSGQKPYSIPCTPKGIIRLLDEYNINLEGLNATVIGRSNIVGKPIAQLLLQRNATVTTVHSKTKNIEQYTKNADLIVAAVGVANFLKADMVKENAIIIDVGISRISGRLIGDVDFEFVKEKASYITPVPGGVGPMTIAMLMDNTLELYKLQNSSAYKL